MKILMCSDGSDNAKRGIRFGAGIALACKAQVTILGIAEKIQDQEALEKTLERSREDLEKISVDVELVTKVGRPVREIARHCRANPHDLMIIGAATKGNFWNSQEPVWMSVKVYKIIESVEIPVLVVIGHRSALHRVLLCSNGDDNFSRVAEFAGSLAQCAAAKVDLFYVMPDTPTLYSMLSELEGDIDRLLESNSRLGRALRRQKEILEELGVLGGTIFGQGRVVPELLKTLRREDYDLVVTGSAAAGILSRHGNLTREIVDRAMLSVLVMRTRRRGLIPFIASTLARLFGRSGKVAAG